MGLWDDLCSLCAFLSISVGIVAVEQEWLPAFVPHECHFSKPLEKPPPRYDQSSGSIVCHMTSTFGK